MSNGQPASIYRAVFIVLALLLFGYFLYSVREVLILFVLAFLLGYAINPLIEWPQQRGVPRAISLVLVLAGLLTLLILGFYGLIPALVDQIGTLVDNIPNYVEKTERWWEELVASNPSIPRTVADVDISRLFDQLGRQLSRGLGAIVAAVSSLIAFFIGLIVVTAVAFYGLSNPGQIRESFLRLVPPSYLPVTLRVLEKMNEKIGGFLRGIIIAGFVIGSVSIIGLEVMGIQYALTLGIIAGLMEMVPLIGPIISGVIAGTVAFFQEPILALYVAIFWIVLQQLENHILVPNLMGQQVGLHPVTIIFSTLVMADLLGIVGLFLAVPAAAFIKILVEEVYLPHLKPAVEEAASGGSLSASPEEIAGAVRETPDQTQND